ncbi:MAG: YidC/Oxa1 family membrane protein insertase [Oscillospiraceae bacterium]|nr:YidC/Oxa1 family membrane protein insertase [Oscillospiraceae bacterium]
MTLWEYLTWPFAKLMVWLYNLTGNYGLALILFSLTIILGLTPFQLKSKKGQIRSARLQPKIQELQKRHAGNQQKLNQEMQKLYQEEGASPLGGCLWSLLPMFLLFPIYRIVIKPITRMMFAGAPAGDAVLETVTNYFTEQGLELATTGRAAFYSEIQLTNLAHEHWTNLQSALAGKIDGLMNIDLGFLGMNLGETPAISTLWNGPYTWAAIGLFLIPIVSAAASWLGMKVAAAANPQNDANPQAQATAKSMNLMMPVMSLWIGYSMPAAMAIYWIANSVFTTVRDLIITRIVKKQIAEEDAVREASRSERERELEEKRLETERLRAEGKTEQNANTSKKKLQAGEKQKSEERKAALERAERAARRERLGVPETEKPASQVGNRRYARGRAYVEDRFDNPEQAEEATLLAAEASENAPAIDETVEAVEIDELVETVETVETEGEV